MELSSGFKRGYDQYEYVLLNVTLALRGKEFRAASASVQNTWQAMVFRDLRKSQEISGDLRDLVFWRDVLCFERATLASSLRPTGASGRDARSGASSTPRRPT